MKKVIHIKTGKNRPKVEEAVSVWKKEAKKTTDALGSYTGRPEEKSGIIPEQDSDDL